MHFVAYCQCYPQFGFIVQALRKLRKERGDQFPSGYVHFNNRVLDTQAQGFDEDEAVLIRKALEKRTDKPLWGEDIVVAGESITGEVPDGRITCPTCGKRFDSHRGLASHLYTHERPQNEEIHP